MFKAKFYQGLLAGILSSIAAIIYNSIYHFATETDFSRVLGISKIIAFGILIGMLISLLNFGFTKWFKKRGEIVFNFILSIVSFACVIIPISITLPLKIQFPELFPGLAVPMVFFPALAWYTINPLFVNNKKNVSRSSSAPDRLPHSR